MTRAGLSLRLCAGGLAMAAVRVTAVLNFHVRGVDFYIAGIGDAADIVAGFVGEACSM